MTRRIDSSQNTGFYNGTNEYTIGVSIRKLRLLESCLSFDEHFVRKQIGN
jgi:hypothetical protein